MRLWGLDHWDEKVPVKEERDPERVRGYWGGWRWSWSLFFCAPALDHLHQVDIRRVYSGVCNCILSLVLHCQPWKWNLINPDQFLMYKMNWQRFKKESYNSNQVNDTCIFLSEILLAPPPYPNQPCSPLSYYNGFIFLSEEGQEPGGLKEGGVVTGRSGWIAQIYCSLSAGWTNWIDDLKQGRTICILLRSLYQKDGEPYFICRTVV